MQAELDQRVQAAVTKAVADVEKREDAKSAQILAAAERRYKSEREADRVAAQQIVSLYQNKMGRLLMASNYPAPRTDQ
jgi:N-acetyl-beta-hexosaminidase